MSRTLYVRTSKGKTIAKADISDIGITASVDIAGYSHLLLNALPAHRLEVIDVFATWDDLGTWFFETWMSYEAPKASCVLKDTGIRQLDGTMIQKRVSCDAQVTVAYVRDNYEPFFKSLGLIVTED